MAKILKFIMIMLMILGITLSILNFISVDSMAINGGGPEGSSGATGTLQSNGLCLGEPLNC
jgi:hypothetical protein